MKCPKCRSALGPMLLANIRMEFCVGCRGLWFEDDSGTFVSELSEDFPNPQSAHSPEKSTRFPCPHCHRALGEMKFANPHNVLLDQCRGCRGVWLDRGELNKMAETAPGFQRPRSKILRAARCAQPKQTIPSPARKISLLPRPSPLPQINKSSLVRAGTK